MDPAIDIAEVKLAADFADSQQDQLAESFGADIDFVFDYVWGSDFVFVFDYAVRIQNS